MCIRDSVESDDRAADLGGEIHDLHDLLAEHLTEGPAEDGEVLGEDGHLTALDHAVTSDHPVAVGAAAILAELGAAMPGELVHLDERALVQQHLDPLAGGLLAFGAVSYTHLDVYKRQCLHAH